MMKALNSSNINALARGRDTHNLWVKIRYIVDENYLATMQAQKHKAKVQNT
jgi:hypothetical protein